MRKLKMLTWNDSPKSVTGFGIVAKNILRRMYDTGEFELACIGINHFDEHIEHAFSTKNDVPYPVYIGQDLQSGQGGAIIPQDRMGRAKAIRFVKQEKPDIFFMMRDLWDMVYQNAPNAPHLSSYFPLHLQIAKEHGGNFRIISHFPLEYEIQPGWKPILDMFDYGYCFTAGGMPQLKPWSEKISWCPQGADTSVFRPLDNFLKKEFKEQKLRISANSFVILNVNRNQPRKDIEATIASYAQFLKNTPVDPARPPVLWLHMRPDDSFGDARALVQKYGLQVDQDVFFPPYFNVGAGWTEEELNMLYNSADVFISTSVAEGFGLTPVEAGVAGCPVLVPGHTGFLQTVGRLGMPYVKTRAPEMRESIGPSPIHPTDIEDMAEQLAIHYRDPSILQAQVKKNIGRFTEEFGWDNIFSKYWVPLLETVQEDIINTDKRQENNKKNFLYICEEAAGDILGASKAIKALRKRYPDTPIDFMCRDRFGGILEGMPEITKQIKWDINKMFDYPPDRVFYPHSKIRHGSWSNAPHHLMDLQAMMCGLSSSEDTYINTEEFDTLLDSIDGEAPPIITVNTSSQGGKMIDPQKWQSLIYNVLRKHPEVRFAVVGGKEDMMVPAALDFRGLPWQQQAWLQKHSFCHVGIDSSPGHFASSPQVAQPNIIFWGWTNPEVCKPERYNISFAPLYAVCCPRLGPCHGVQPQCGINQYNTEDAMRAPCLKYIDVRPATLLLIKALDMGLEEGREWLKGQDDTTLTGFMDSIGFKSNIKDGVITMIPSVQHEEDKQVMEVLSQPHRAPATVGVG